jgi:DNA-binding response OmpR family regulator
MKLLLVMVSVPRKVWSRSELLSDVWDYDWGGDTRIVDVHVQRLRTKIGSEQIRTVRGFGYTMDNHR